MPHQQKSILQLDIHTFIAIPPWMTTQMKKKAHKVDSSIDVDPDPGTGRRASPPFYYGGQEGKKMDSYLLYAWHTLPS